MNNVDRVIKVYTDAGFNLQNHSFKAVGKNQVRATIRTLSRIHKDSRYTINLFCGPLIRAGFKVVRYTTKSDPMPNIIPVWSPDPVRNAEIQDRIIADSLRTKGMLSILIELPCMSEESPSDYCATIKRRQELYDKHLTPKPTEPIRPQLDIDQFSDLWYTIVCLFDALHWELDTFHTNASWLMNDSIEKSWQHSKPLWGDSRWEVWTYYRGMKHFVTSNCAVMVFSTRNESLAYIDRHKIHHPGECYYQIRDCNK